MAREVIRQALQKVTLPQRVLHGSSMGILRKALRQLLQQHPHVATVAEAPQNEGGGGATVVELRV